MSPVTPLCPCLSPAGVGSHGGKRRQRRLNGFVCWPFNPPVCPPLPSDASCTDKMDELDDADVSRGPGEPAVKRERIEMSHPLQEM